MLPHFCVPRTSIKNLTQTVHVDSVQCSSSVLGCHRTDNAKADNAAVVQDAYTFVTRPSSLQVTPLKELQSGREEHTLLLVIKAA
jgi:hypothetical protein